MSEIWTLCSDFRHILKKVCPETDLFDKLNSLLTSEIHISSDFRHLQYCLTFEIGSFQIHSAGQSSDSHEEEARGGGHQEQQMSTLPRKLSQCGRGPPTHTRRSSGMLKMDECK